jgi:thiamine pyrophosphokinase
MPRAILFANGDLPKMEAVLALLDSTDVLIAVDGGTGYILRLGLLPAVVIGDLDSLAESDRKALLEARVSTIVFDREKDETDLELALAYAARQGYQPVLICGALGGRLDQTLANLFLVSRYAQGGMDIRMDDGVVEVFFIDQNKSCEVHGKVGDTLSLLPWGRTVERIVTTGLKWDLKDENLHPHQTRGVSNVMRNEVVSLGLRSGLLLVIHSRHDVS